MDLGFKDVHVLVTGKCVVLGTPVQFWRGNGNTGASGGIGLETTKQFLGTRSPFANRNLAVADGTNSARGESNRPL